MITKLKIRYLGDPCLKVKSEAVKEFDSAHLLIAKAMVKTMYEDDGVGLAAPQVGINERFFVADIGDGPVVIINPKVVEESGEVQMDEGCLSFPGISVPIKRPQKIKVKYIDLNNNKLQRELEDLLARVFLHEIDHLNGITIIDHAPEKNRKMLEEKVNEFLSNKEKKKTK